MTMNWYLRRRTWVCPDCGALNQTGDYNCEDCRQEEDRCSGNTLQQARQAGPPSE